MALVIAFLANVHEGNTKHSQTLHLILGGISQRPGNISLWVVAYLVAWQIILSETFRRFASSIKRYFTTSNLSGRRLSRTTIHTSASNFAKMVRVSSTETISRISSAVMLLSVASTRKRSLSIAERDSFLPLTTISSLTLKDMAGLFLFLSESSQRNFSRETYFDSWSENMKQVIRAIEAACFKSKGATSTHYEASPFATGKGDVDALLFAAVTRIFAEWRYIRLVPEGYKRYAVGMALARRDMLQNIAKLELEVHVWLDHVALAGERLVAPMPSPTLRQLLQFEVEQGVHPKLPRLTDKSGANGLLWIYRQLIYQTYIFANTLEIPKTFPTTKAAVTAAYQDAYGAYHSWPIQQMFQQSFRAAPELHDILDGMVPERQKLGYASMTATTPTSRMSPQVLQEENEVVENQPTSLMPTSRTEWKEDEDHFQQLHQAMVGFATEITMKWKDFLIHLKCIPEDEHARASFIATTDDNSTEQHNQISPKSAFAPIAKVDQADLDALMAAERADERASDALCHISEFQNVMGPVLEYLKNLIVLDFHMNDPTRI
jgi:hypothetical protein